MNDKLKTYLDEIERHAGHIAGIRGGNYIRNRIRENLTKIRTELNRQNSSTDMAAHCEDDNG